MRSAIPEDILGFLTSSGYFFWRRSADRRWCCIHAACGPQDITYKGFGKFPSETTEIHWPHRTEVFRKGDILEFKL